jgi:hypothetical protein
MRERVARETVIKVLQHEGVEVTETTENGRVKHILSKGDIVEAHFLPEVVPRHLLGRFAVKFGFSMGAFWQPDLLDEIAGSQNSVH